MRFKAIIIFLLVFLSCASSYAQREILPVDWKEIKTIVSENPELVKDLVKRLCADELDTTLTYSDRIIAFYGQAIISDNREDSIVRNVRDLFRNNKFEDAFDKAQKAILINPLNIDALFYSAMAISAMNKNGNSSHSMAEGQVFYNIMMRIFNTIAYTGYGTKEHPFYITKVSDEYAFMRQYLELWEYASQTLEGHCDVFELTETSIYYQDSKIYFDATLPLEFEMKVFGNL